MGFYFKRNLYQAYDAGSQLQMKLKFGFLAPFFQKIYHRMKIMKPNTVGDSVSETFLRSVGGQKAALNVEYSKQFGKRFEYELSSIHFL
jgi:hypothetical protein